MIDPENPGLVLAGLPSEILKRMMDYIAEYQPGHMLSNYPDRPQPAIDQVKAAKEWIEAQRIRGRMPAAKS